MDMYHITTISAERRPIFMWEPHPTTLLRVLLESRQHSKFLLHEFAVLPDQLQAIITPQPGTSIETVVHLIRDEFSARLGKQKKPVWQPAFTVHKIETRQDYDKLRRAIHLSPVRAGLAAKAALYPFCSASPALAAHVTNPE
jgi:REP element-mobilizing transposase RayT